MGRKPPTDKIMVQQKQRKKSQSLQFPLNTPEVTDLSPELPETAFKIY